MEQRIKAIQNELQHGEGVLINNAPNRLYLTGFSSSAGVLLITKNSCDFLIDFRYYEKAQSVIKHCNVHLANRLPAQLKDFKAAHNLRTIYIETSYATVADLQYFKSILPDCTISAEDIFDQKILDLRSIKSKDEIDSIKKAQAITDDTFAYILDQIHIGKTEREIMLDMEFYLRKQGSSGVAFDFIVVSGKNSSLPHGVPTNKAIESGDFITMDFGAVINGYRSDMTRTVAIGNITQEQKRVYNTVLEAQELALHAIKPNAVCKEIDRVARDFINQKGYEGCFGHGLGHSVGIEIHESPSFNTSDQTMLRPGMVITVEPGIYLPGQFGVRIEDMVAITESGMENLTASPKNLIQL